MVLKAMYPSLVHYALVYTHNSLFATLYKFKWFRSPKSSDNFTNDCLETEECLRACVDVTWPRACPLCSWSDLWQLEYPDLDDSIVSLIPLGINNFP